MSDALGTAADSTRAEPAGRASSDGTDARLGLELHPSAPSGNPASRPFSNRFNVC